MSLYEFCGFKYGSHYNKSLKFQVLFKLCTQLSLFSEHFKLHAIGNCWILRKQQESERQFTFRSIKDLQ